MESTPVSLLVRLARRQDPDAWRRFVALFAPMLHGWVRRAGAGWADADDVLQEAFIVLHRDLPGFERRGSGSFRAWLRTVVMNRWRDALRRQPVATCGLDGIDAEDEPEPDTDDEYRAHLCGRALRLLQTDYPELTWRAFWATVVDGRPVADVAREFGLTPNAIYLSRGRILGRLRSELADFLG
jgi:RNA polymerase sigma-70 factor, ECF subfamily